MKHPLFAPRWRLFIAALDRLALKRCEVNVVELPVAEKLLALRAASRFPDFTESLRAATQQRGGRFTPAPAVPTSPNAMYDISHLNEAGQQAYTAALIERLSEEWR